MSTLLSYKDDLLNLHHSLGYYKSICDELFALYPDANVMGPTYWVENEMELEFSSPTFQYQPEHFSIDFGSMSNGRKKVVFLSGHLHLEENDEMVIHRPMHLATFQPKANVFELTYSMADIFIKEEFAPIRQEFKTMFFNELLDFNKDKPATLILSKYQTSAPLQDLIKEFENVKLFK